MRFPFKAMLAGILIGAAFYFVPFSFPFFFFFFFLFFIARLFFGPWWWGYRRGYYSRRWWRDRGLDSIDGDDGPQPRAGEGKHFTVS